jgi:Tfp pilus assembly protein PilX
MSRFVITHKASLRACHLGKKSANGAVLIVSLVMLTILTIIAVGTMTDTNLQTNMARNSQISLRAFNVSLSELKAQFQASRDNDLINNGQTYQQVLSDVYQRETDHQLLPADLEMSGADNPFAQTVTISFLREGICGGGNEIGGSALIYEINATSMLDNTGINSDQSFGICYPNPND